MAQVLVPCDITAVYLSISNINGTWCNEHNHGWGMTALLPLGRLTTSGNFSLIMEHLKIRVESLLYAWKEAPAFHKCIHASPWCFTWTWWQNIRGRPRSSTAPSKRSLFVHKYLQKTIPLQQSSLHFFAIFLLPSLMIIPIRNFVLCLLHRPPANLIYPIAQWVICLTIRPLYWSQVYV